VNLMNKASKLQSLRALINDVQASGHIKESLYFAEYKLDLPCGGIVSIGGFGKTTKAVHFLSEHPDLSVAWIEERFSVYPCAMLQQRVALSKVLFTEADRNTIWTCLQILQSGLFKIVVICSSFYEQNFLRKIQLAAEKAHAVVILLSEKPISSWTIVLQI